MVDHVFKIRCLQIIDNLIRRFNINARPVEYVETSSLSTFKLFGFSKISDIKKYEDDFKSFLGDKLSIKYSDGFINITLPKPNPQPYPIREILDSQFYKQCPGILKVAVGENAEGQRVVGDLEKWVHLLVCGETGGGKSVFLHSLIASLIHSCDTSQLRLVLIDLKRAEFVVYEGLSYLQRPIAYEEKDAQMSLKWLIKEMNGRFKQFQKHRCRNIQTYNERFPNDPLPYIVTIIDEFADVTSTKENEKLIIELSRKARASGIHLVLATQRPSSTVVTGDIKTNIPTRIAFAVPSHIDSRVILDENGAENLNKKGDMILKDDDGPERIQGCFISDEEIEQLIEPYIIENQFELLDYDIEFSDEDKYNYDYGIKTDELTTEDFHQAAMHCIKRKACSHWSIKKFLKVGDRKGYEVLDWLKENKIINENEEVIMTIDEFKIKIREGDENGIS